MTPRHSGFEQLLFDLMAQRVANFSYFARRFDLLLMSAYSVELARIKFGPAIRLSDISMVSELRNLFKTKLCAIRKMWKNVDLAAQ